MDKEFFKVLVVEDEPLILNHISNKIEELNSSFKVVAKCTNGFDALNIIKSNKPDVVFTDIRMPLIDGLTLISTLQEIDSNIEFVIISSYSEFDYAQTAIRLGVKDYLLKPIKTENLLKTLSKIKTQLSNKNISSNEEILFNCINGFNFEKPVNSSITSDFFLPLNICIGNLITDTIDKNNYYKDLWTSISIKDIIKKVFFDVVGVYILKEKFPNQKTLVIEFKNNNKLYSRNLFKEILSNLILLLDGKSLTISTVQTAVSFESLFTITQNLKEMLQNNLILDTSSVIFKNDTINDDLTMPVLDITIKNKLRSYISNRKFESLDKLIKSICYNLQNKSQLFVLNQFTELILLFEEEILSAPKDVITNTNDKIIPLISENFTLNDEKICCILKEYLYDYNSSILSTTELVEKIESYIIKNFSQDISIINIANKLSYSPSYITKIFKKHKKMTPQKYITLLRIKESQNLIENEPTLTLKEIGELIGYPDPTYFSRVFKKVTGKSPINYKKEQDT